MPCGPMVSKFKATTAGYDVAAALPEETVKPLILTVTVLPEADAPCGETCILAPTVVFVNV